MSRAWVLLALPLAGAVLGSALTCSVIHRRAARTVAQALPAVQQHEVVAQAQAAQGQQANAQAAALAPALAASKARVARLEAELQQAKQQAPTAPQTPTEVDGAKDQLITAQRSRILELELSDAAHAAAADHWRKAYEQDHLALGAMKVAYQAQAEAAASERWQGRLEGGAPFVIAEVARRIVTGGW